MSYQFGDASKALARKAKVLWKKFVAWLAKNEIKSIFIALGTVYPEMAILMAERVEADAKAKAAEGKERADLLKKLAVVDAKLAKHADFEAAVDLLTSLKK